MRHRAIPPREQYQLFDETVALRRETEVNLLPETAKTLEAVIGLQATIDLVKAQGGNDLPIPAVVNGTSMMWEVLVEAVGPQAAKKLVEYFHNTTIYVPKCYHVLLAHRDREIIARYNAGVPIETLRRDNKLTRRHVIRVLKKPL